MGRSSSYLSYGYPLWVKMFGMSNLLSGLSCGLWSLYGPRREDDPPRPPGNLRRPRTLNGWLNLLAWSPNLLLSIACCCLFMIGTTLLSTMVSWGWDREVI